MVIWLVFRISRQIQAGKSGVAAKNKLNTIVTASHIGVTLAYTITQAILIFFKTYTQDARMYSAFYFFGGLADIFLSVMLWFVLDSQKQATVLVDGNRVYSVAEVIKLQHSVINEDCEDQDQHVEEDADTSKNDSVYASTVSRRMIEQFFAEIEGPDRDWQ
jgi:hypothetical protein